MSGMSGGSMLRTRRKDVNVKPNRRLDRKSSRGMLYENEELRLRTININAEVEKGQSDIKKLKRENEQLRREVGALRGEYDRLERLLKARHQQDNSDAEESGSCCSDCESECCNTQNNVNAACDTKKDGCCCDEDPENDIEYGKEDEGSCSMVTGCGKLSAVPEEPILRVPYNQHQNLPPCNCQLPIDSPGFIDNPQPSQDYFTAVVTVPMASHLPETQNIQLTPASVYPKTGLDILINNNNAFENFQGFTVAPPIGFIIPTPSTCEPYESDSYQIVPNVDLNDDDIHRIDDFIANKSQKETGTENNIQNRNTMDDILGSFQTLADEDSYLVCNTKKVIQQLTTVQNTNVVTTSSTNTCNCNCNPVNQSTSNPDIIVVSSTPDKPSYITEKNIELQYDYPKSTIDLRPEENHSKIRFEEVKTQDITQTTQTTTEVNSTIMLFSKKKPIKNNTHERSHSAPAGTLEEPIYATVQKLPKKLKRLHIKKLENEIKYVPPEEKEKEVNSPTQSILKVSDQESMDEVQKLNGGFPKIKVKSDSFSESSEKNDTNARNSISNSPVARKKKRFTIHFKRKNKRGNDRKQSDTLENVTEKNVEETKEKVDSDRLIEHSSSADLSEGNKFKDSPTFTCKKHKRHMSRRDSMRKSQCPLHGNANRQIHQCDKCIERRKSSGKICEHIKKSCSPVRNYFKNDSYQEMTTSHSERERTNSLSSSAHSGYSLATNKSRKMSSSHQDENIPWCGCWGNSCL